MVDIAKAWINDRWLKAAQVKTAQGRVFKEEPTAYMKHSLSNYTDDPENAKVAVQYRAKDFGKRSLWEVQWRTDGITRRKLFATGMKLRLSWPKSRTGYD